MKSSVPSHCPECHAPLHPGAAGGLCARCLMAGAAEPTEPAAPRSAPPAPEELAAAFPHLEVLEIIGRGGMGAVYKVRQPKLDRFAALKLLPQSPAGADGAFAGRFAREAKLLARLNHANIVAVYDHGQAGDYFYLLMEYVDGVNLRQAMRASRFTPDQALAIVPKICEALQYAHDEGVLHRDIKPENILLDAKGRVKLADFGIAKLAAERDAFSASGAAVESGLTQSGTALGTPSYMAPEQQEHPSDVDHRADIYSLGVVFYELLTGDLPQRVFMPPSAKSAADPRIDAIVQQALEKERSRRQGSAAEVRTQVERISDPAASSQKKRRSRWRKLGLRLATAAVILLILRAFFIQPFRAMTDAMAPEVLRGSHVLVWKPGRTFAPGDLIAYESERLSHLGRVVRSEGDNIIVSSNRKPEFAVPRSAIVGRVISVYWRGDGTPRAASPGPAATFGPVMERVVPSSSPCVHHYLQFQSGVIFDVGRGPGTTKEELAEDWSRAEAAGGVDVEAIGRQFIGEGCLFTAEHQPNWEKITAEEAVKQLHRATWISGVLEPKPSDLPVTYLFKTTRGQHGILQLLGVVPDDRGERGEGHDGNGMKLRYKMVQAAPPP